MSQSKTFLKYFRIISINLLLLIGLWIIFYKLLRHIPIVDYVYEQGIYAFTKIQLIVTKIILNILGYTVEIYGKTIKIVGSNGVHLDRGCLGRNTLGLLLGFIYALPGRIKHKIYFTFIGVSIFLLLNIGRITALAITDYCCPQRLDFNHHFLFKIIVYIAIFILWTFWIKKHSYITKK